jgi:branched-chain amino acid transport system substrate-binding protein
LKLVDKVVFSERRKKMKSGLGMMSAVALAVMAGVAHAQGIGDVIRIGILNDQSGPYADVGGKGSAIAAKLAVEEFGGKLLGKRIEVIAADHQNKPDIASAIARQWIDNENVDVIADGAGSSASLAIQQVTRDKGKIFIASGPASSDFTGKACSPTGFHFTYDTYALANGTARALVKQGGDTWFFLTADYAFGHALERDTSAFVVAGGGKVLGSVKLPLNTSDFSSALLQAQASKAKVIGLANAGADTINSIKQAAEFGVVRGGQRLAGLLVFIADVQALGLQTAQGLVITNSFYWDLTDKTRAWTQRYMAQNDGRVPTMIHAGTYSGVLHYLRAAKAANSTDPKVIAVKMHEMPVNDMYNEDIRIRPDGRVLHKMFLMQVKSPAESKSKYDYYKLLAETPGDQAFRPMEEGQCPYLKKE